MSEEIQRASVIVPRTIMFSMLINGLLGFAMVLGLMFCIGDVQAALAAQRTLGYPYLEIFQQAVKSVAGTCLMASIIICMGYACQVGVFTASTRMLWSFARDKGTPFSWALSKVRLILTSGPYNLRKILTHALAKSTHIYTKLCDSIYCSHLCPTLTDNSRVFSRLQQHRLTERCWAVLVVFAGLWLAALETHKRGNEAVPQYRHRSGTRGTLLGSLATE